MSLIFSRQCEYALQAFMLLARKPEGELTSIKELTATLDIPFHFLAKILQGLSKKGLLISEKGRSGGFALNLAKEEITLFRIVEAIDGMDFLSSCVMGLGRCPQRNPCTVHERWSRVRNEIYTMLIGESISELARDGQSEGDSGAAEVAPFLELNQITHSDIRVLHAGRHASARLSSPSGVARGANLPLKEQYSQGTHTMKPTEELSKEHRAIQLMLRIMESACGRLETEAEVPTTDLRGMIEFLQIFADKCHHGKEEEVLFPALESAGVPRERGPIGVMLSEHVLGRTYIRQMSVSADRLSQGDESARDPFIANARAYINLLTMHIQKEDHVLFPMADATLPDAVQQDLLKSFERIEAEKIGPGKHEELHALLHQWKTKYLGNEM